MINRIIISCLNAYCVFPVRIVILRMSTLAFILAALYSEIMCTPRDGCDVGLEPDCTEIGVCNFFSYC